MCADIRDGREQLPASKGRIQMSKTNYLQAVISDLQRTAGPYRCANKRHMQRSKAAPLFDHLVGAGEQRRRHVDSKHLGCLQVE